MFTYLYFGHFFPYVFHEFLFITYSIIYFDHYCFDRNACYCLKVVTPPPAAIMPEPGRNTCAYQRMHFLKIRRDNSESVKVPLSASNL